MVLTFFLVSLDLFGFLGCLLSELKLGQFPTLSNHPKDIVPHSEHITVFMTDQINNGTFLYISFLDQLPEGEIKTYKVLFLGSSEVKSCF